MKKITSFTIDHLTLMPGLYVSRKDYLRSDVLTTFDIRLTAPNREEVLDTGTMHAIEHLGATFLRNDSVWQQKVIYFGPMGCRTGFYLILVGDLSVSEIIDLVVRTFLFIAKYEGEIPGAKPSECGNYKDMNLLKSKKTANRYLNNVLFNIHKK